VRQQRAWVQFLRLAGAIYAQCFRYHALALRSTRGYIASSLRDELATRVGGWYVFRLTLRCARATRADRKHVPVPFG